MRGSNRYSSGPRNMRRVDQHRTSMGLSHGQGTPPGPIAVVSIPESRRRTFRSAALTQSAGSVMNKLAMAFVTEALQKIGPSVTRLLPSCYAEPLEYLHDGNKAGDIGYPWPSL
jgi:hypothetical protein